MFTKTLFVATKPNCRLFNIEQTYFCCYGTKQSNRRLISSSLHFVSVIILSGHPPQIISDSFASPRYKSSTVLSMFTVERQSWRQHPAQHSDGVEGFKRIGGDSPAVSLTSTAVHSLDCCGDADLCYSRCRHRCSLHWRYYLR